MTRTITKKDSKALELIKKYKDLSREVGRLTDEITKREEERNTFALKGQKIKDKLQPLVDKLTEGELNEFEMITNVQVGKNDGEVEIDIYDQHEQWIESFRKRKDNPPAEQK